MAHDLRGPRRGRARRSVLFGLGALVAASTACKDGADACAGIACSDHGDCYLDGSSVLCVCDDGYFPDTLQRCQGINSADPCEGVPCSDHGTCRVVADDPTCDCDPGYHPSSREPLNCVAGQLDGPPDTDASPDGPPCVPVPETCNGADDDCDGEIDEGCDATPGTPCTTDEACAPAELICNENWGVCAVPDCGGRPDFTPCETLAPPDRSYDICVRGTCVSPGCGDVSCNVSGPGFSLADTNQRACYDATAAVDCATLPDGGTAGCETTAFCGQDGQYGWDTTHAPLERFTRSEDTEEPTVIDHATGLTWQGCSRGQTGAACTGSEISSDWATAVSSCDALTWAGWSDWRLPDEFELHSLVDCGLTSGFRIDLVRFPGTYDGPFWSSSTKADAITYALGVTFAGGFYSAFEKTDANYVRCVRGRPTVAGPRFARSEPTPGEPVVADAVTGLVWQGCAAGMTSGLSFCGETPAGWTWQVALDHCQDSTWAGFTDWYLPSVDDLFSIVDNARDRPAADPVAFPGTPLYAFWSSSTYLNDSDAAAARYVNFASGYTLFFDKANLANVRCVRAGP